MKLTRLRLIGFKSFVEPTDFLIEPGLTGVVGPNGCGKSNLVEALRWVMGETSHKSMPRRAEIRTTCRSRTDGTTPVRPGSIRKSVGSTKDLKPISRRTRSVLVQFSCKLQPKMSKDSPTRSRREA